MNITCEQLDAFVEESDRRGGPGWPACADYWQDFSYQRRTAVDQNIDPFSEDYVSQQISLYHEISGRQIYETANEMCDFPLDHHVGATNPYGVSDMARFPAHYIRLSNALRASGLRPNPRILDLGAGWGLSSEFLAMLGAYVTAVDINPKFVELIQRRQARNQLPITAIVGSFDDFEAGGNYDAALFYECLHHAIRPWKVLERVAEALTPEGRILFCGEPINDTWKHWGLRQDALSIYCIRKYGWFESGWTEAFIRDCLKRAGFSPRFHHHPDNEIGTACVAYRLHPNTYIPVELIADPLLTDGWIVEDKMAISTGKASIDTSAICRRATTLCLKANNFRPREISYSVSGAGRHLIKGRLAPGQNYLLVPISPDVSAVTISSDCWRPSKELGSSDKRMLSFHVEGISFA